jgi:hypothetical protein
MSSAPAGVQAGCCPLPPTTTAGGTLDPPAARPPAQPPAVGAVLPTWAWHRCGQQSCRWPSGALLQQQQQQRRQWEALPAEQQLYIDTYHYSIINIAHALPSDGITMPECHLG